MKIVIVNNYMREQRDTLNGHPPSPTNLKNRRMDV